MEKKIALLLGEMLREYNPGMNLGMQRAPHIASAGVFAGVCTAVAAAASAVSAKSPNFPASIPGWAWGSITMLGAELLLLSQQLLCMLKEFTTNSSLLSKGLGRCWASIGKV